ncbi:DNA-binding protein reb1 [Tritrichomonas foetus]|uniref:DNA-binding protein reb1 n=1 Tax=Tritrichomonas foetus TaxID=1144522 RepID=A0A1J4KEW7_9EUKA|nr:DNA-binding protein reb1 [Tritrichomonas foetus]|eukprot:OHT09480.1 DNA-binding protein reb1 [Tritrichomonas foetus]
MSVSKHRPSYFTPKIKFTQEEDKLLIKAVTEIGTSDWRLVSTRVPGRNPRQCRERWNNYVNPQLVAAPWTSADDELLKKKFLELGPKWHLISTFFAGRSTNSIKNRFVTLKRRQKKRGRRNKRSFEYDSESSDESSESESEEELFENDEDYIDSDTYIYNFFTKKTQTRNLKNDEFSANQIQIAGENDFQPTSICTRRRSQEKVAYNSLDNKKKLNEIQNSESNSKQANDSDFVKSQNSIAKNVDSNEVKEEKNGRVVDDKVLESLKEIDNHFWPPDFAYFDKNWLEIAFGV